MSVHWKQSNLSCFLFCPQDRKFHRNCAHQTPIITTISNFSHKLFFNSLSTPCCVCFPPSDKDSLWFFLAKVEQFLCKKKILGRGRAMSSAVWTRGSLWQISFSLNFFFLSRQQRREFTENEENFLKMFFLLSTNTTAPSTRRSERKYSFFSCCCCFSKSQIDFLLLAGSWTLKVQPFLLRRHCSRSVNLPQNIKFDCRSTLFFPLLERPGRLFTLFQL